MKHRNDEKDRLRSIPSKSNPIPFVLKIVSKFLKTHQNKQLCRVESTSMSLECEDRDSNKYDEKDTSPMNLDTIPHNQSKERDCNTEKATRDPIPLDLEIEILSRLPAKSLIKFQCVSKIWSSIIRSQSFVDSFFSMSSMRQSRFLILFSNGALPKNDDNLMFISSSSYEREEASSLVTNLDLIIPFDVYLDSHCKCASVHGLIGFAKSGPFIVCNPSTGKVTTLPCSGSRTSLGYDPVDDQFKALTLVSAPHIEHDFLVHQVLTLEGGESSSWTRNEVISPPYYTVTKAICISGFVYFGAWTPTRDMNPVIVCFDVRFERISFIKAPVGVVYWEGESILIEYKGKLAAIARHPYHPFSTLNLWILEDVKKHDWSKQTFMLPFSLGLGTNMISPGINKAGEIIFASRRLSRDVQPFYIFYYNVERKDIRKVMLKGIADDEQFRRRYGFPDDECRRRYGGLADEVCVHILPEHIESIASL